MYEIDYGPLLSFEPEAKLTTASRLPDVYRLLRGMELEVRKAGLGGSVEFWAGPDVAAVLLGIVEQYSSTAENRPYHLSLEEGRVAVGGYTIRFMDETYPNPEDDGEWLPKLDAKTLLAVAKCGTAPLTPFRPTMRPRRCTSCRCPVRTTAASC